MIRKILHKIDTQLGQILLKTIDDLNRIQYHIPKIETDNSRLNPKKGGKQ